MNVNMSLSITDDTLKPLKLLDQLLRCGICYDYLNVCMLTSCGHNYCSLCIRKYMSYKAQCPTCFQITSEPELKNNRLIDEIVQNFIVISEKLLKVLEAKDGFLYTEETKSPKCLKKKKNAPSKGLVQEAHSDSQLTENSSVPSINLTNNHVENGNVSQEEASCPVCSVQIPLKNINRHLDDCLKRTENGGMTELQNRSMPPKRMPKLVYRLLKDNEIRSRLSKLGLPTQGTREEMIKRHHSFTVLYNSNMDSKLPRPQSSLIKQVIAEEEAHVASNRCLNFTRNSDPKTIEKEQNLYRKKHKAQYKELIASVRSRQKRSQHKQSNEEDSVNVIPSSLEHSPSLVSETSIFFPVEKVEILYDSQHDVRRPKRLRSEKAKEKDVFSNEVSIASTSSTKITSQKIATSNKSVFTDVSEESEDDSSHSSLKF